MMKFLLFITFIDFCLPFTVYCHSSYGPFDLTVKKVVGCNGPKKRDCAIITGRITNDTILQYDMIVKENITNIHVITYAMSSETKQTMKLQLKDLCNHPFWQSFMEKLVNFKNCHILKGDYHVVLNVQDIARSYYAGSFIYGRWTFKTILYNNNCNFSCSTVDLALTPKQKKP